MSRRIINVETVDRSDGPGFVLDIYESHPAAYRAEVRAPNEDIIMVAAGAKIDGDSGLLEAIATHFAGGPNAKIAKELVEGARLELELRGHDATPEEVSGLQVSGVVMEALSPLRDAWPDIGADALADVAARVSVELHRRFLIKERT